LEAVVTDYDVIVVGGRPAGSTLAARLGQRGLNVLLIERAEFPSPPGASSPIIFSSTMALLDEIGADETAYAHNTPPLHHMVTTVADFHYEIKLPPVNGRDYAYAIDRARFDAALWNTALSYPTVTGKQRYTVHDLIWDDERVTGIIGQPVGGEREHITAKLVIGADGRFSTVARKANAETLDEEADYPTTLYYAYWKNVAHYDERGATSSAYFADEGLGFLVMDSADETTVICVEARSDILTPSAGKAEDLYLDILNRYPDIRARLENAEQVTEMRGMRKIGNLYRTPGGAGWALVGDAYHQKDPIDGQGIYDAVFTAKMMARAIDDFIHGRRTWDDALTWYDATARAETFPVYQETLNRVKNSLYDDPFNQMPELTATIIAGELENATHLPMWAKKALIDAVLRGAQIQLLPQPVMKQLSRTMTRWLVTDSAYQEMAGKFLTRQIQPDGLPSSSFMLGIMMRGPLRDLSNALDRIDRQLERIQQEA
jgi:2-polyprenyl-6-methoxyphenol hydroxylase-like FAD-dependent oxidoreductase